MTLMSAYIEKLFDEALESGETVVVPCSSYKEMERIRTKLYREKARMFKKIGLRAEEVDITREILDEGEEKKFIVYLSKSPGLPDAYIIDKAGKTRVIDKPVLVETEQERMIRLMREDGMSEEEIDNTLHEKAEDDFDKAASKIEALQGLKETKKKGGEKK